MRPDQLADRLEEEMRNESSLNLSLPTSIEAIRQQRRLVFLELMKVAIPVRAAKSVVGPREASFLAANCLHEALQAPAEAIPADPNAMLLLITNVLDQFFPEDGPVAAPEAGGEAR
jgi:hypothetical protein